MLRFAGCAPIILLSLACSDPAASVEPDAGAPQVDAGLDASGALDAATVDASIPVPMLPVLTPCPSGWREVQLSGLTTCDPWPASGEEACLAANAHIPGTAGCQRLGPVCPASGWANDLPVGASILYVDPNAPNGGQNGSQGSPFRTMSAALTQSSPGQIIALAAGDYEEEITVGKDVEIWGACAESTRIVATATPVTTEDRRTLIAVQTPSTSFRNLSIIGGFPAFELAPSAGLHLENALISRAVIGVELASQSQVSTNLVAFRDRKTVHQANAGCGDSTVKCAGLFGDAIFGQSAVDLGASVSLRDTITERTTIRIDEGTADSTSTLVLDGVVVDASIVVTRGRIEMTRSRMNVIHGATVVAEDSTVQKLTVTEQGILRRLGIRMLSLRSLSSTLGHIVEDVVLATAIPGNLGFNDRTAISIVADAQLDRVAIFDAEGIGLRVEADATIAVQDLHVFGATEDGPTLPTAVGAYEQATISLSRFLIQGSDLLGVQIMDDAQLTLSNGTVENCAIGANVQVAGYDLSSLQSGVSWLNNEVDIDAEALVAPPALPEWQCADQVDNDSNGASDCADDACAGFSGCAL